MNQEHIERVSINILCDISKELIKKVIFTNIINQCSQLFDIDNGLVLKQSTITQLNQDILQEINYTYQQDDILSLIYPMKLDNNCIQMVVNLQNDGIYEKIDKQKELFKGNKYYVGLPSGQNKQLIQIENEEIIINSQSFKIKESMEIVFVKKISNIGEKIQQVQMANPSNFSSKKHAHIKVQNGRIFLNDGFQQQNSKNGVWILIKHQRFSKNNYYCFKDFRLKIGVNS
ncbi:unnamed protein product [Paramecium primaurelia]|uniref:FHA domain-containing protein n=1 Tax=Paramecium primaurelia TaxID=5886 RepID=A0A8S1KD41_PARPR|nr:unnamed protein product [Paramecium primaurelia]